jgi:hypothetical protein
MYTPTPVFPRVLNLCQLTHNIFILSKDCLCLYLPYGGNLLQLNFFASLSVTPIKLPIQKITTKPYILFVGSL